MSTNRALTNVSAYAIATAWVGAVAAQSSEPADRPEVEPISEVVVTGIRQSLGSVQAIKQSPEQIVDSTRKGADTLPSHAEFLARSGTARILVESNN